MRILTLAICVCALLKTAAFGQTVIIDENFDDSNFTNNPAWTDAESKHIINASNLLQLDAPGMTNEAVISTPSDAAYGEWEALVQLGFNPSGSNLSRFYIVSETRSMKQNVDGYYIQIGGSDDEVSLYRQNGSSSTKIIDGIDGLVDSNPVVVRVKTTRELNGNWELFADAAGGSSYTSQGTITDNTYQNSQFIGFLSDYTSTRSDLFEYDDIKVIKVNPPLKIQDAVVQNNTTVDVQFNLDIDPTTINAADFSLDNGIGSPNSTSLLSSKVVRLSYNSPLSGNKYTLTVDNIDDAGGNTISPNSTASFFVFGEFSRGDVIINEFAYDAPGDQSEFVELKNTTAKLLNLQNWQIGEGSGTITISGSEVILQPNDYVVISSDTTALYNIYGTQNYVEANLGSLNNDTDFITVLTPDGTRVDSLLYTSSWGGNDVSLERRSDTAPSVYKENFGDSPDPNGGTPGLPNEVADDITPPDFENLVITDNQTLDLNFSERLENGNATNIVNFTLDNGITINNAQQTAGDSIRLSFSSPLQNGSEYQLTINNQQDIFGNTAGPVYSSFNYYEPMSADSGDIFINEFMYDPPAGSSEYIELYNPTNESFDLDGWTINDNSGDPQTITNSSFIMPPDSFVVIAPDQTVLQQNPGIALVAMGSNFPSLNNSGDDIVLRDDTGERLDSLTYSSGWGGSEIALERRTTNVAPIQANFGDALNGFGTPGEVNQIPQDNTAPGIEAFSIVNNQTLQFVFTEQVEQQSTTNTDNYSLTGGIIVSNVALSGGDTVSVILSTPLQNNTQYTATVDGVEDLFGNTLATRDTSFTYYETSPADSGDIFLNELTYDPPEGSTEYIELYNPSDKSLNLQNWTINDNTGNRRTITNNQFIVPPDSFMVIAPDQTLLNDNPDIALVVMGSNFPSLNNSGDDIVLRDDSGEQLDSLRYNSTFGGNNIAIERRTVNSPPVQANFGDAPNGFGTPGSANQIPQDNIPPNLINLGVQDNQTLNLAFSEGLDSGPATTAGNYSIDNGITVSNAQQFASDSVRLMLSPALQNNTEYTATINGVSDLFGNTLTSRDTAFTYFEVASADSGDIFINEFTYDPPEGSTEYIEIANATLRSFNLEGWTINDNTGNRRVIINQQFIVPPDSFVVIAPDQTLLQESPNIALISMSQFPALNNSGDDIVLRDSTGQRLDSLSYSTNWGGDQIALERRTLDVDPIQANFGNAPNGFGTPGWQNQIGSDNTPPGLEAFSIINSQSLQLVYTEQVVRSSATNTDNYSLSGGITVNSITLAGTDTVRISLSNPLQNNTAYTASINGINDPFGNTLTNRDTTFTYFEISAADSGDVFINEFVYDPPGGQTEYIELFNLTNRSLNLQNWTINDNTGSRQTITDNQYIIPPGNRVVISSDPTLLQNYPEISLVTMGSRFPSLNNSGDDIVLRNDNGQLLDSLRYTSAWGGDEIALERRTTDVNPVQANFGDSPNGFGTPGSINDIPTDDQPPVFTALRILDKSTFRLIFSESITGETATQKSNYSISPNPGIQIISAVQDTVTLFLSQELQSDQTYQVTIRGLMDLFGNTITETSESQPYLQYSNAQPGSILINEFLYTRESAGDPEFVELFNPTDQNFDLSGWKIGDASGTATIDAGVQLRHGDYLVLTDNPSFANELDNGVYLSNFPSLNDDEDIIYLQDDGGVTIDSVSYSPAFGGTIDGKSAERKDPRAASNDPSNFATSTANDGSTPGTQNSVFAPDKTPPTINFARIFPNGDIEVRFSEFISLNEDVQFSINDQSLTVDTFNPEEGDTIFLNTPESIQPGTELTLVTENLTDVSGNNSSTMQISVAQLLRPGDVVINEIMYDPISDSEDNLPDQSEYIELRNTRDYAVSLEGITLHDAADEDGEVRRLTPVSTRSKYIPAQVTALIYADKATAFKQSQTAQFFELSHQPEHTLIRIDRNSLSLASTDDAIYFTGNEGIEIDSVFYDENWQNPNLVDTDGIALERISPEGQSNDESNWGSSTNERGGTPNSENSIYQKSGAGNQDQIGISFEPNPFSPDDDGTDDHLFINYKMGQSDYLITVTIYDRYGRKIRELADGKPAGFEGSLIWDGLSDNGNRNRIGIYIIIFEAFDSASGGNRTFKETVVLARRLN